MTQNSARREALAHAATDYALRRGLIGLSLRPLGAAIGTSDRMLLYHFRDKDDLVSTVLRVANDQGVADLVALPVPPTLRDAVLGLWKAASTGRLERCQRLYVQAAALGLLGHEPYLTVVREANERWLEAVMDFLRHAGCPEARLRRASYLVVATFMGLQLDLPLDRPDHGSEIGPAPALHQAVTDLATAAAQIASSP